MREFILRARKAWTSNINLNELPKQGKLDAVCAAIANALWISGDVRKDSVIHAVLEGPGSGPKTITFIGNEIKGLRHDERSIASYISEALKKGAWLKLNEEARVRTGIIVAKKSFERLVWEICKEQSSLRRQRTERSKQPSVAYWDGSLSERDRKIFVLDKDGKDIRKTEFPKDFVVIFGSAEGLPSKAEKFLREFKAEKLSLGPKMLFAAHCPIVMHNEIDRRI